MSIFASLIWILIIVYFVTAKGKKEQDNKEKNNQGNRVQNVGYGQRSGMNQNPSVAKKNFAVMPEQKKVKPNVERKCAVEDGHRSENNVNHRAASKPTPVPNVSRPYTELPGNQKMTNKKRQKAMRLYEGDAVPKGYRMVKCRYCAAENLIAYSARGDYMCYFCNTDL